MLRADIAHRHGIESTGRHPKDEQRAWLRHELLDAAIGSDVRDVHTLGLCALHAHLPRLAVLGEAAADPNAMYILVKVKEHVV